MATVADDSPHHMGSANHSSTTATTDNKDAKDDKDDKDNATSVHERTDLTKTEEVPQTHALPEGRSPPQPRSRPLSAAHSGPAQEYLVKNIEWFDLERREKRPVKIITQNGIICYLHNL